MRLFAFRKFPYGACSGLVDILAVTLSLPDTLSQHFDDHFRCRYGVLTLAALKNFLHDLPIWFCHTSSFPQARSDY